MGRPLNSRFFSGNKKMSVQFHNGASTVTGRVVKQLGDIRFRVTDDITTLDCSLAQTTEDAQSLKPDQCTLRLQTLAGTRYVKRITSALAVTTTDELVSWSFDGALNSTTGNLFYLPLPPTTGDDSAALSYLDFRNGTYRLGSQTKQFSDIIEPPQEGAPPRELDPDYGLNGTAAEVPTFNNDGVNTGAFVDRATFTQQVMTAFEPIEGVTYVWEYVASFADGGWLLDFDFQNGDELSVYNGATSIYYDLDSGGSYTGEELVSGPSNTYALNRVALTLNNGVLSISMNGRNVVSPTIAFPITLGPTSYMDLSFEVIYLCNFAIYPPKTDAELVALSVVADATPILEKYFFEGTYLGFTPVTPAPAPDSAENTVLGTFFVANNGSTNPEDIGVGMTGIGNVTLAPYYTSTTLRYDDVRFAGDYPHTAGVFKSSGMQLLRGAQPLPAGWSRLGINHASVTEDGFVLPAKLRNTDRPLTIDFTTRDVSLSRQEGSSDTSAEVPIIDLNNRKSFAFPFTNDSGKIVWNVTDYNDPAKGGLYVTIHNFVSSPNPTNDIMLLSIYNEDFSDRLGTGSTPLSEAVGSDITIKVSSYARMAPGTTLWLGISFASFSGPVVFTRADGTAGGYEAPSSYFFNDRNGDISAAVPATYGFDFTVTYRA